MVTVGDWTKQIRSTSASQRCARLDIEAKAVWELDKRLQARPAIQFCRGHERRACATFVRSRRLFGSEDVFLDLLLNATRGQPADKVLLYD